MAYVHIYLFHFFSMLVQTPQFRVSLGIERETANIREADNNRHHLTSHCEKGGTKKIVWREAPEKPGSQVLFRSSI